MNNTCILLGLELGLNRSKSESDRSQDGKSGSLASNAVEIPQFHSASIFNRQDDSPEVLIPNDLKVAHHL